VFNLHYPAGPPQLRENYGFGPRALRKIADTLFDELTALCLRSLLPAEVLASSSVGPC
jgi:hypothetical protein